MHIASLTPKGHKRKLKVALLRTWIKTNARPLESSMAEMAVHNGRRGGQNLFSLFHFFHIFGTLYIYWKRKKSNFDVLGVFCLKILATKFVFSSYHTRMSRIYVAKSAKFMVWLLHYTELYTIQTNTIWILNTWKAKYVKITLWNLVEPVKIAS